MDVSRILDPLNPSQREAVSASGSNVLVLAGAGSGKTRVLVHRVAWLLQVEGVQPWSILAVTFTNKAAREMRARIEEMLEQPVGGMWVGTFHGLAHRFLRAHWQDANLPQQFQILDSDDQFRLIKRILKMLELDESRWPPRQIQGYINKHKDEGRRSGHIDDGGDYYEQQVIRVYREYEDACARGGLLDFADLLLRTHELLRDRPDILHHYRQRFRALLVDEFQDTNAIQYAWLRLLTGDQDNLFLVGDDDQSIYGWRGARVENILSFQHQYPNTTVVRLEQNYRSSGNILAAANALIANNPSRLGKELWTDDSAGDPLRLYSAFNEVDEARFVAERVRRYVAEEGLRRSECAILYRTTAQSRLFEEALLQIGLPYRVYGGQKFFERVEIKDALAYLRLLVNPHDDAACERVLNVPARGIGTRTVEVLRGHAREARTSLWQAAHNALGGSLLSARATGALRQFVELITRMQQDVKDQSLADLTLQTIDDSGLPAHYEKAKDGRGIDRLENLEQLVEAARRFEAELEDEDADPLGSFLAHAALEAGEGQADGHEDAVQLMTLHSAKGLEFPVVFVTGVEEGLFPHSMSADDPDRLEEERRLCYVGMTRAMQQLYLTHAESRRLHGREEYPMASRFLRELPAALIEEVRAHGGQRRAGPVLSRAPADGAFQLGEQVLHPKFGTGVVLNSEGTGASARIQVNFEAVGPKWLVLAYARLERASE
ncbi:MULTISPECIES: DNA helicase II [Thiorhodovibrio]|uniref:DNA helicase II n=1 Tax=Thiorhodovibrio TaxID=61593 RepID=UPI00191316A0|nr:MULTISPECIES: DNA helicase II [Thiorhodovibrio]MBK5967982.1 DNA helicase II [Thiorhodovibrio winogradskyi]WPL11797.1 DNA helicase II [Thiorhodovibrio litoralis]